MNLNQLSNQIESNAVNDANGWGESITITSGVNSATIKSFCDIGDYRQDNGDILQDTITFMSCFIDFAPTKGSVIDYGGAKWIVTSFTGNNPYDITASSNKRSMASREAR